MPQVTIELGSPICMYSQSTEKRSQSNIVSTVVNWLGFWQIRIEVPLVLVLNPSGNGGNFTTELPRNVVDSKGASNADTKFLIKIDGKGVDYKELANNVNARILSIDFSKDNRFVEIIGTQMVS